MNGAAATKTYRAGTHRSVAPQETLRRVLPFAPVMGITRIANVTGLDSIGLPVVMVCRPNSRSVAVSQGKGLDLVAAKASGLMESVEAYHAETITLPLRLCSYEELRYAHPVVDIGQLPMPSTGTFHPNVKMLWSEGRDLLTNEPVFVPFNTVHTDYTWPLPAGSGSFVCSSNGLASGNDLLEATSHAICEVVERDSTALWRFRDREAQESTAVDLATVDDPMCRQVLETFEHAGLEVAAWDMTSDVGIASFACVIHPREDDPTRRIPPAAGAGCHPARSIALLRALTECAQSRLTHIAGSRDDIRRDSYADQGFNRALDRPGRKPGGPGTRSFRDAPDWTSDTLDGDVDWELGRLRAAGIERVIAIDLTKDFFKIPVVRVVIPGLEGPADLPGYVPGMRARALATATSQ
jgi:ribosomal protein S12 methylthiotransferase accessory factor